MLQSVSLMAVGVGSVTGVKAVVEIGAIVGRGVAIGGVVGLRGAASDVGVMVGVGVAVSSTGGSVVTVLAVPSGGVVNLLLYCINHQANAMTITRKSSADAFLKKWVANCRYTGKVTVYNKRLDKLFRVKR